MPPEATETETTLGGSSDHEIPISHAARPPALAAKALGHSLCEEGRQSGWGLRGGLTNAPSLLLVMQRLGQEAILALLPTLYSGKAETHLPGLTPHDPYSCLQSICWVPSIFQNHWERLKNKQPFCFKPLPQVPAPGLVGAEGHTWSVESRMPGVDTGPHSSSPRSGAHPKEAAQEDADGDTFPEHGAGWGWHPTSVQPAPIPPAPGNVLRQE